MSDTTTLPIPDDPENLAVAPDVEAVQEDYFGVDENHRIVLPKKNPAAADSWIEFEAMTEGKRIAYNKALGRDIRIQQSTRDAIMKGMTGEEKSALITTLACNWNLVRGGKPVQFSRGELRGWLENANPAHVDHLDREIRKLYPFLDGEPTLEEIDRSIDDLQELRKKLVEEQAGKAASSDK